jgi:hypothetical protein
MDPIIIAYTDNAPYKVAVAPSSQMVEITIIQRKSLIELSQLSPKHDVDGELTGWTAPISIILLCYLNNRNEQ